MFVAMSLTVTGMPWISAVHFGIVLMATVIVFCVFLAWLPDQSVKSLK